MENLEHYLSIASNAARQAGDMLMKGYGQSYGLIEKEENHYSIEMDSKSNALYESILRAKTPEISLYTEEGERSLGSDLVWMVDSLDGSYNYRVEMPLFVTQICLLYKSDPVVSVIYNPILKQEFSAIKGQGSFLNGGQIFVGNASEIEKSTLAISRLVTNDNDGKTVSKFSKIVRAIWLLGSTGLDLSSIAAEKSEIAINYGSKIFDYAPGVLLVREAGGLVTNFKGEEWTINDNNLVAANKYLMPKVLEIIKGV
jgi:myo-inositol-1(or 4)-monophosphatase